MSNGGLSKARLCRMHNVMAGYVERGEVPGIVTLISRRGEVHADEIGMMAVGGSDEKTLAVWCKAEFTLVGRKWNVRRRAAVDRNNERLVLKVLAILPGADDRAAVE